ncbi:catalase, partial [Streptomyces sp. NPDC005921]
MRSQRAHSGSSAVDLLERAEHLSRGLDREREAADFLFSRWAAYAQGIRLDRAGRLAGQLLAQGEASEDSAVRAYGWYAWGIHQWGVGNIGEAYRYLSRTDWNVLDDLAHHEEDPLRRDLRLLAAGMLAMTTALHGDVDGALAQLATMEAAAGDDPYAITVWAAYSARVAALIGDPARALHAAECGIDVDPAFSFGFLGAYLIEQMAQFNRERIPERQPHAKGSGAFGHFEVTEDVSAYTMAGLFQPGTRTDLVIRFSTVAGERGSPDTWRDPRGFAVKFYTGQGNYDMVGNNTPVFFVKDPMKFQHFIRSQKRRADSNLRDHDMQWDFWTLSPESARSTTASAASTSAWQAASSNLVF